MVFKVKKMIKKYIKIITLVDYVNNKKYNEQVQLAINNARNRNKNCIFITNSPRYENLGDHAIMLSQIQFFKINFKDNDIVLISIKDLNKNLNFLKSLIKDNDLFIISGGGFIGTLWMQEQESVNKILLNFNNNPIIIFPQTVYFDENAKNELNDFKILIKNCNNLEFCLRDLKSYNFIKNNNIVSDKNIYLLPDIVLFYKLKMKSNNRQNVLFCIRKDKEKIDNSTINEIYQYFIKRGIKTEKTDTVIKSEVSPKHRERKVLDKLQLFLSYKLVITDRLHGMIFAAITNTPCIAFDNISKKVSGVYNLFLKDLNYIEFLDINNDVIDFTKIEKLYNLDKCDFNNNNLNEYYDTLIKICNKYLSE